MGAKSIMHLRVGYYDEAREPDDVIVGQFEYLVTQRKLNKSFRQAVLEGDVEYMSYLAYSAARRMKIITPDTSFDAWMANVASIVDAEDEDTTPEAEPAVDGAEGESPTSPA